MISALAAGAADIKLMAIAGAVALTVGAAGGGFIGYKLGHSIGHQSGDSAGYQRRILEEMEAAIEIERNRSADDAKTQSLSNYDFCVRTLRDSGMPIAECERLRGLPQK